MKASMMVIVAIVAAVALTGCPEALDLQDPELEQPDANTTPAIDTSADTDATTSHACPTAPAGCTAFTCTVTNSCYYACSGRTSWIAAQSYCTQIGAPDRFASLATIEGQLEQQCVTAATLPTSSDPVWTGLYQLDSAHEPGEGWLWTSGDTSDWRDWGAFEPYELVGDRDCGVLADNGAWKADVCNYTRRFVCAVQ
ncbi:MAG TPA: C-type lectin domain-containing protein [Kofleriaceae bacterium]|jgi:hypothetical protein|nr:C-type lectin domain-containing protein [Kofleriaceae bacterium]